MEAAFGEAVDLDSLEYGIDHPVFLHAVALVEMALGDLVGAAGAVGEHLDDEVGGTPQILFRDQILPFAG